MFKYLAFIKSIKKAHAILTPTNWVMILLRFSTILIHLSCSLQSQRL